MALLDEVMEASGGRARWDSFRRFTLQLSIDGALFSRMGSAGRFKDVAAEGSTRTQLVRFNGFPDPDKCGVYQPDCVTIEGAEGQLLRTWSSPHQSFREQVNNVPRDELYLVFICGLSVWNYLTTPFLLARPDVEVEELSPWREHEHLWRRLRAVFPSSIFTHSSEQVFYFDGGALQRRTDHDLLGTRVADYSWAHQSFCKIVIPTLRRSLMLRPDGSVVKTPPLLDVEIFDASFE
jgi:hypothetical protein